MYSLLEVCSALQVLQDPLVEVATAEIVAGESTCMHLALVSLVLIIMHKASVAAAHQLLVTTQFNLPAWDDSLAHGSSHVCYIHESSESIILTELVCKTDVNR